MCGTCWPSGAPASSGSSAAPGLADGDVLDALWDLVWAGEVTNDAFAAVRASVASGAGGGAGVRAGPAQSRPRLGSLAALGPPRGQGRWSAGRAGPLVPRRARPVPRRPRVAGVLLERYGVLTRDAVRSEGVPGGFSGIYPVLRAMEESGRIRRGYFVAGLGGAQFALPGAVDRLRGMRDGAGDDGSSDPALVLAATDPANAYGLALPWPAKGPQRVAGAYVVLVDLVASLYVERGGRRAGRPPRTVRRGMGGQAAVDGPGRRWDPVGPLVAPGPAALPRRPRALPQRRRVRPVAEGPGPLRLRDGRGCKPVPEGGWPSRGGRRAHRLARRLVGRTVTATQPGAPGPPTGWSGRRPPASPAASTSG